MKNKFYIKQFILNNVNSFQDWERDNYADIVSNDAIIGYLFSLKESIKNGPRMQVLNLYLIKRNSYSGIEVSAEELGKAWELFLFKCDTAKSYKYTNVFVNPPFEQWLDTKDNWCKKVASDISHSFDWTFSDALSEVYITLLSLYKKGTIYMGNLSYLKKSIYNSVLCDLRFNRKRLNMSNDNVQSLDTILAVDADGKALFMSDIIPAEEAPNEESLEYRNLLSCAKALLRKTFSEREIDQIINYTPNYLPLSLYRRLLKWRSEHKVEELYGLEN